MFRHSIEAVVAVAVGGTVVEQIRAGAAELLAFRHAAQVVVKSVDDGGEDVARGDGLGGGQVGVPRLFGREVVPPVEILHRPTVAVDRVLDVAAGVVHRLPCAGGGRLG